jgi:hypothetical protein
MKYVSVKSVVLSLPGAFCLSLLILSTCSPTKPAATPDPFADFIIANQQISGWVIGSNDKDSVFHFVQSTLSDVVDGGNFSYCGDCNGSSPLKAGIHCVMNDSTKQAAAAIFVMDYGTAANAKSEFDSRSGQQLAYSVKDTIPSFPDTVAVGAEHSGGITAFAHFGNYYCELELTGYDPSANAAADADLFFSYFKSKVK